MECFTLIVCASVVLSSFSSSACSFLQANPSASCFYISVTVLSGSEKTPHLTSPTQQRRLLKTSLALPAAVLSPTLHRQPKSRAPCPTPT